MKNTYNNDHLKLILHHSDVLAEQAEARKVAPVRPKSEPLPSSIEELMKRKRALAAREEMTCATN